MRQVLSSHAKRANQPRPLAWRKHTSIRQSQTPNLVFRQLLHARMLQSSSQPILMQIKPWIIFPQVNPFFSLCVSPCHKPNAIFLPEYRTFLLYLYLPARGTFSTY